MPSTSQPLQEIFPGPGMRPGLCTAGRPFCLVPEPPEMPSTTKGPWSVKAPVTPHLAPAGLPAGRQPDRLWWAPTPAGRRRGGPRPWATLLGAQEEVASGGRSGEVSRSSTDGEIWQPHAGRNTVVCSQGPRDRAVTSHSRNRRLGHSRNSATSPPRRLLLGAGLVGTATLPCPPSASSPQASSRPQLSSWPIRKGSYGKQLQALRPRAPSSASEPQAPPRTNPWDWPSPKTQPGAQAFPSQSWPWTPTGS